MRAWTLLFASIAFLPELTAQEPLVDVPLAHIHQAPLPEQTPYIVLRPPQPVTRGGRSDYTLAPVYTTTRRSYAYGWFGAQPRTHYTRHFGFFRGYTQWTHR